MNLTVLASLCAGIAVTCTALVFVEFFSALSARYRERFIQETSVEMDDVLLNMPPSKILDVSLALAAACAAAAVFAVGFLVENMTVMKGMVAALLAAGSRFLRRVCCCVICGNSGLRNSMNSWRMPCCRSAGL